MLGVLLVDRSVVKSLKLSESLLFVIPYNIYIQRLLVHELYHPS